MRFELGINRKDIYNRIKQVRKEMGLTQAEFADKMGISFRTYQRFETMQGYPSKKYLSEFCEITGVNYDWLVFGKDPKRFGESNKDKIDSFHETETEFDSGLREELDEINNILSVDKVLRKRILNFLRFHRNLEKFDNDT